MNVQMMINSTISSRQWLGEQWITDDDSYNPIEKQNHSLIFRNIWAMRFRNNSETSDESNYLFSTEWLNVLSIQVSREWALVLSNQRSYNWTFVSDWHSPPRSNIFQDISPKKRPLLTFAQMLFIKIDM